MLVAEAAPRNLTRCAERHHERGRLGARPPTALLSAAVDQWLEAHAAPHIECSDALRGVHLVAGDGQQIGGHPLDVHGDLAHRLGCVGVKENFVFPSDSADGLDGLDRSHLIVRVHDGNEDGVRPNGPTDVVWIDHPRPIHRYVRGLCTQILEEL